MRQRADPERLRQLENEVGALRAERNALRGQIAAAEDRITAEVAKRTDLQDEVRRINTSMTRRASRAISLNIGSLPAEMVPGLGATAALAATFYELRDACLTMAEMREMSTLIGGETEADLQACGYTFEEFKDIVLNRDPEQSCEDFNARLPQEMRLNCALSTASTPARTGAAIETRGGVVVPVYE